MAATANRRPTGDELRRLQDAILYAYSFETLKQMVRVYLNEDLLHLVPFVDQGLQGMVNDLVFEYASRPGGLHEIMAAARSGNPTNPELTDVVDVLLTIDFDPLPKTGRAADPVPIVDPLADLPPLSLGDLPQTPFRNILRFRPEDAAIFFGRGLDIRDLYQRVTTPNGAPIVLYYGQSGVGKSSLLVAGLLPRLKQVQRVKYARREQAAGLVGTLVATLDLSGDLEGPLQLRRQWLLAEAEAEMPLTVILDQVEEIYSRPNETQPNETADLLDVLTALFGDESSRPRGRLILSFRKEWLAEIKKRLEERKLAWTEVFLQRLDDTGVVEAVQGPAQDERLRAHFGLVVKEGLAEEIAGALLEDPESAVAPTLQILLDKMWKEAKKRNYHQPTFDHELYQSLRRQGLHLKDFLGQQLDTLAQSQPDVVESGLVLDLLAFHTTRLGTAEQRLLTELQDVYSHAPEQLDKLLPACRDLYLLVDPAEYRPDAEPSSRLAHDTLAPLVRARFDESNAPGQRARRILESRSLPSEAGEEAPKIEMAPLGDADLAIVMAGQAGMRIWTDAEQELISDSLSDQIRRQEEQAAIERERVQAQQRDLEQAQALALVQEKRAQEAEAAAQAERTSNIRQRRLLYGLAVVLVTTLIAAVTAAQQWEEAQGQLWKARIWASQVDIEHSKLVADRNPVESVSLSVSALPPPVNNFGYPYLSAAELQLQQAMASSFERHRVALDNEVQEPAIAVNDKQIAVGGYSLTLFSRSSLTSTHLISQPYSSPIEDIAWSDNALLLSRSGQDVRTWQNGKLLAVHEFDRSSAVKRAEWLGSSDKMLIAVGPELIRAAARSGEKEYIDAFSGSKTIRDFSLSSTGRLAAAWNEDNLLVVLDLASDTLILEYPVNHGGRIKDAIWSSDDKALVTLTDNGQGTIWLVANGQIRPTHSISVTLPIDSGQAGYVGGQFGDEEHFITWSLVDGTALLWSTQGNLLRAFQKDNYRIVGAELSPDAKVLAVWNNTGDMILWELATGNSVTLLGHKKKVLDLIWHRNGYLASASSDGTIRLWTLPDPIPINEIQRADMILRGHESGRNLNRADVLGLHWQGNRELLSYGVDGSIRVWEIFNDHGELLCRRDNTRRDDKPICYNAARIMSIDHSIRSLQWLDDETLVTVSDQGKLSLVRLTDEQVMPLAVEIGENSSTILSDSGSYAFLFPKSENQDEYNYTHAPTGSMVIDSQTGEHIYGYQGQVKNAFWLDDLLLIDPAIGPPLLVDPFGDEDGVVLKAKTDEIFDAHRAGNTLATTGQGIVRIWDVTTGTLRQEFEHTQKLGFTESIRLNHDGSLLAAGSLDVSVWGIGGEDAVLLWQSTEAMDDLSRAPVLSFAQDADVLAVGMDKRIIIWDRESGIIVDEMGRSVAENGRFKQTPSGLLWLEGAAWASDARRDLLLSWDNHDTYLWELVEGDADQPEQMDMYRSIPFIAPLKDLVVGLVDQVGASEGYTLAPIGLWQIDPDPASRVISATFNHTGTRLATGLADGRLIIWDAYLERPEQLLEIAQEKHLGRLDQGEE